MPLYKMPIEPRPESTKNVTLSGSILDWTAYAATAVGGTTPDIFNITISGGTVVVSVANGATYVDLKPLGLTVPVEIYVDGSGTDKDGLSVSFAPSDAVWFVPAPTNLTLTPPSFTNLSGGDLDSVSSGSLESLISIEGTFYAGGYNDDIPFVMSYDSSNQVWTNLSGGYLDSVSSGYIYTLTEVSGVLYAGGEVYNGTGYPPFVMSYDSSNQVWTNLSGGDLDSISNGYVQTLTEVSGVLYAGGTGNYIPFVMSYDSSNQVWTNLSGGDLDSISDGTVQTLTEVSGVLYAGGTGNNIPFVMSYDSSTHAWTNLSGGDLDSISNGGVFSLTEVSGVLYAGGRISNAAPFVMSYDSSNQVWTNLSGGAVDSMSNVFLYSLTSINGVLYAGGRDNTTQPGRPFIMSYNGSSWTKLSGGVLDIVNIGNIRSLTSMNGNLYAGGDMISIGAFVISYTNEYELSWSGVGETYSIQSYQGLYDASGIATTSYDLVGFEPSGLYSFTLTAQFAEASSSQSMAVLPPVTDIFNMNTLDVATRKQFLIDNAASFPSPIITLSGFDITTFLTSDTTSFTPPQNITMILPNVDISSAALPDANASLYLLGTPGTAVVYTVDGVSSEIVFDTSSVTVNAVTVQIGGVFVLFGRVYSLAGCGSALVIPVTFTADISGVSNNDGTANITWTDVSSADSFLVEDGAGIEYATSSLTRSSATVTGLQNSFHTFYVRAIYDASGMNPSGSVLSTDSITIFVAGGGGGGGGGGVVPCFLANAPVLTPTGYTKISKLSAGDKVMTGDGRVVAIQKVSHTRVAAGPSVNPYVIPKGLYGATKRLLISPDHRVSTAKGMLEARLLGLEQEEMAGEIDYYNLELPSWSQDTMVVAGVVVESLAPVRRITMTLGAFKKALVAQYGELTPAVLAKVQKTCRLVEGGRVECPVLPTHK